MELVMRVVCVFDGRYLDAVCQTMTAQSHMTTDHNDAWPV